MGEKLESSPLVEALCEFRFSDEINWDWTIPGQLYDIIKDKGFEKKTQVQAGNVTVDTVGRKAQISFGTERVQLQHKNGSSLVQIGPNMLTVNVRDYDGWKNFKQLIQAILKYQVDLLKDFSLSKVGLRYVNHLNFSVNNIDLENILTVAPSLQGNLEKDLLKFYQRYELNFDEPKGRLIHQTGTRNVDNGLTIVLDLDFVSQDVEELISIEKIGVFLDSAHEQILKVFVDSLNENYYLNLKEYT